MKTENAFLQLTNFDYTKNLICELNPMISCEKTKCLCEYEKKDILWNRAHNNSYCSKTYWTIFMDGKRRNTVTMLLTNGWFGRFFSLYQNDINSKFHSLLYSIYGSPATKKQTLFAYGYVQEHFIYFCFQREKRKNHDSQRNKIKWNGLVTGKCFNNNNNKKTCWSIVNKSR